MHNRKMSILAVLLLACVGLTLVACGGGDDKGGSKKKSTSKSSSTAKSRMDKPAANPGGMGPAGGMVDLANAGMITGKFKFGGTPPAARKLDTSKDKWCVQHNDITDETLVVAADGSLRDVFVYVEGLEAFADKFPEPETAVKITQEGCQYHPHVLGIRVDQDLEVINADDTSHNYHFTGTANDEINKTQPKPGTNIETFDSPEIGAGLACDIHPWMKATIHIMEHPCFAVSATDGSFTIKGVPPGKYKLRIVHGAAKSAKDGMEVTVSAKGTANVGEITLN